MSGKILHKRSLTGGSVPTISSLDNGELAINVNDGKVYLRRSGSGNNDVLPLVTANTITTGSITADSFTGSLLAVDVNVTGSLTVADYITLGDGSFIINSYLHDTNTSGSVGWSNRQLYDENENTSINWGDRRLLDDAGNSTVLVWGGSNPEFFGTASLASGVGVLTQDVTIAGSLTITQNLTVLGSSSIQYITSSQLDIGTNIITVNVQNPSIRFGGLAVIDSGSSPRVSGSFLYDSVEDEFIFVHKGSAAGAVTSSHFLLGPETYNDLGNEIYLTANRIPKSVGNEHLNDSNISDNGSLVNINSNTNITGSTVITGSLLVAASPGVPNIDSANRYLYDSTPVISVDWNGKQLNDTGQVLSIDWANRTLNDTGPVLSIDWANRTLNDNAGTIVTAFSDPTITQHYVYSNKTHNNTNLENFSSTFKYAGVVLQGVSLDTNAPVALYDLVYLDTDGIWYQVINDIPPAATISGKLGIVVDGPIAGAGDVLLEGDIVVNYNGTGAGPRIYTQGILESGNTVYVGEYNPYPGGSMANDIPGTGGTLRILGHLYYNNLTSTSNWILRFNPSNEYYRYI